MSKWWSTYPDHTTEAERAKMEAILAAEKAKADARKAAASSSTGDGGDDGSDGYPIGRRH